MPARADLDEGPAGGVDWPSASVPPAGQRAVDPQPAGVSVAGADLGKAPGRRRGLAVAVQPPTGQRAVGPQPAGVTVAGAEGLGKPRRSKSGLSGAGAAQAGRARVNSPATSKKLKGTIANRMERLAAILIFSSFRLSKPWGGFGGLS